MADNPSSFTEQPAKSSAPDEGSDSNIRVGDVTGSTGVAIGPGATATVTYITGDQQYDVHDLVNPYLGLRSFTYADHAKYAGREKLIAETVVRLTAPDDPLTLLFVTGASGSGKSSFVQAGVLSALKKHYDRQSVVYAIFRPSRDPLAALSDTLWRQLGVPQYDASTDFGDFLKMHTPPQQVNVIVIDQFEELFTQSNTQPRDALFNLLANLPPFRSTRTHIIATMRADYLPELFALPELYDIAKRGIDLHAMSVDELREAIQQPLRTTYPVKDKRFQSELVDRLAKDAAEDAAYLPLLQVTLEELWRKGRLTLGSYTNLADAIKQRADKVLEFQDYDAAQPNQPRPLEEQPSILNLCLDLVDVSLDDEARRDVRRRRSKEELISGASERAQLIDTLAQARLLSVDTDSSKPTRVEVDLIHETLLSNWDRLRQEIAEKRHELRQRARFEQQLKEWIEQNQSDDYLLSGVRLAEARDLERRNDIALHNGVAKDFVRLSVECEEDRTQKELDAKQQLLEETEARRKSESERAQDAERAASRLKTRNRIIVVAGAVAFLLAAVAGVFGFQSSQNAIIANRNAATAEAASTKSASEANRSATAEANAFAKSEEAQRQARISRASELAAQSQVVLDEFPQRSLLLSIESIYATLKDDNLYIRASENALRSSLANAGGSGLFGHEDALTTIAVSQDGHWLVTAGVDKTARLWDLTAIEPSAKSIILRGHKDSVVAAAISSNSRWLVTGGGMGSAYMWDLAAPNPAMSRVVLFEDECALPELDAPLGAGCSVDRIAFSSDNRWLITRRSGDSYSGSLRVMSLPDQNQNPKSVLLHYHVNSTAFALSSNNRWLVTVGVSNTADLWDLTASYPFSNPIVLQGHETPVVAATFSNDSRWLATVSTGPVVRLWDLNASSLGQMSVSLPSQSMSYLDNGISPIMFSPDNNWLVCIGADVRRAGLVLLWNLASPDPKTWPLTILRGHEGPINAAAFTQDGHWLATGSSDFTARLWNLYTADPSSTPIVLRGHKGPIYSIAVTPDSHWLATGSTADHAIRLWNLTAGDPSAMPIILHGHDLAISDLVISPDNHWLVSASYDHSARLWDLHTSSFSGMPIAFRYHDAPISNVAISADTQWLAAAETSGVVRLWNLFTMQVKTLTGHRALITGLLFSPNGKQLITSSVDHTVRIWNLANTDVISAPVILPDHDGPVDAISISPNGNFLVTGTDDGTIHVWDLDAKDPTISPIVLKHDGPVTSAAISSDNRRLATGSWDETVRVWNLTAKDPTVGEIILRGHTSAAYAVAFSPDGHWLASGTDNGKAFLWDLTAPVPSATAITLQGRQGSINRIIFSPDNHWLATASAAIYRDQPFNKGDKLIFLWDLTSSNLGSKPIILHGLEATLRAMAVTPDSHWLISVGEEPQIYMWDLTNPNYNGPTIVLHGHEDWVNTIAVSLDGRWLVSGSGDGSVRLWALQLDDSLSIACSVAGRNLTRIEWRQYIGDEPYRKTCEQWPLEPEATPTPTP